MFILVAEDVADARQALTLLLEMKGHEVAEASNGQEAVDIAKQRRPDLILMDIDMPVLDGLSATRELRAYRATAGVPIIALTGRGSDAQCRESALAAGCDEFFSKPVDFDVLDEAIATLPQSTGHSDRGRRQEASRFSAAAF